MPDPEKDELPGDEELEGLVDEVSEVEDVAPGRPAASMGIAATAAPGLSRKDLLSHYLAELRKYPLLTPEQEREYAVAYYERGDKMAGERLVTANLRLVVKLAFQYHRQWSNVLDLIQEGNVGLVQALSRYDPYRGIRFSSYAQYWIRAMILRFLMDNYRLVRLGSTRAARQLFFQLRKERERLLKEGIDPKPKLLAERLSVPESEIISVDQHLRAPALSLHAPIGEDGSRALADVVPDESTPGPEVEVERSELSSVLQKTLAKFADTLEDDRERAIWNERLLAQDPVSLSVLGERYGVSKERIRQLEVRLRTLLKSFLRRELGEDVALEFNNTGA